MGLFLTWKGVPELSSRGRLLWPLVAHGIAWALWQERNSRVFDEDYTTVEEVVQKIKWMIWS